MATGDIKSVTIRADGISADIVIEGFAVGATYANGLGVNNALSGTERMALSIVSLGYTGTTLTTRNRSSFGNGSIRKAWPSNASKDESVAAGDLTVRVGLTMPVFAKDKSGGGNSGTDIVATFLSGFVVNTGGAGQSSNAAASVAVTNNSTLPYPKVVGRWASVGFQRQTGDYDIEFVAIHPFGQNNSPVAAVAFDGVDQHSNSMTQAVSTSMAVSTWGADAKKIWTYKTTVPISTFTQGDQITHRARAYPFIGDSTSIIDTDTSADGVAAPSESLSPLMVLCDKNNNLACYASVDGVGAGTPTAQNTAALARTTPYATLAAALTALKAFNNTNHSDNSLNNCYVLMQNGTYSGPGTFTGSNTKSFCMVQADLANGATEAGVVFSTATNTACNAYIGFQDVTFSGSGAGMLRGNSTTGNLWVHSCTCAETSTSFIYGWKLISLTQNTVTAITSAGFKQFATNKGPYGLIRGNDGSAISNGVDSMPYCVLGNKGFRHTSTYQESGNANGHDTCDGIIVAWNEMLSNNSSPWAQTWATTSTISKGMAIVGNVVERITDTTTPLFQLAGDNSNTNTVNQIYLINNTFQGERQNFNYQEGGSLTLTRQNWYDICNSFYNPCIKSDVFQNANRIVSDAVFTNGSTILASATANFVAGDVTTLSADSCITNGLNTIASVTNSTTAVLGSPAIASGIGVRIGLRGYIQNANRVGNYGLLYGCGCWGSRYQISDFPRDFAGVDTAVVGTLGFTNDKSAAGTNTGGGDYTPATGSVLLNRIPAGRAILPGDLNGRAISNTGTGAAGAIQPAPVASSGYGLGIGLSLVSSL